MPEPRHDDLRDLIKAIAARSEPITLPETVDHALVELSASPLEGNSSNHHGPPPLMDLVQEEPMTETSIRNRPTTWLAAAAAIAVLIVGITLVIRATDDEVDVATDGDLTTSTITDSTVADDEAATGQDSDRTPADVATEFWEALAEADSDTAVGLLDPEAVNTPGPSPWGPDGLPLADTMRWYGIMDQEWELDACVDVAPTVAECTVTGSDAVTEAFDVAPITGRFRVTLTENGVFNAADHASSYINQYGPQVFEPLQRWLRENRPDDVALLQISVAELDDETAQRFEDFVRAVVAGQQDP